MTTALNRQYINSAVYRQDLVDELMTLSVLHSPRVKLALLAMPREAFVPSFWGEDNRQIDASHPDYLSLMYKNSPLVTLRDERGLPLSSSSMPSVMVHMLEVLSVSKHHTVLEIGTGTGYNAALLSYLSAACTTIDIAPATIEHL